MELETPRNEATTVPAPITCPHECVELAVQQNCIPVSVVSGLTTCSSQEICCQLQTIEECTGNYECTPKELLLSRCNVNVTLSDPKIVARPCPDGSVCCAKKTCPLSHMCISSLLSTVCQIGSIVIGVCPEDKICCQLVDLETSSRTMSSKPSCEGLGRCLAPYLVAECRRGGSGTFSTDFSCSSPRLQCCLPEKANKSIATTTLTPSIFLSNFIYYFLLFI